MTNTTPGEHPAPPSRPRGPRCQRLHTVPEWPDTKRCDNPATQRLAIQLEGELDLCAPCARDATPFLDDGHDPS